MIKLVVSDMDGTLLGKPKGVRILIEMQYRDYLSII